MRVPQSVAQGAAAVALFACLAAAKGFSVAPLGNVILADQAVEMGKPIMLLPGSLVFRQTVVRGGLAHLVAPLPLAVADKARTLNPDDPLEEMKILRAPSDFSADTRMYCATPNTMAMSAAASKAIIGAMAFGLFGGLQRTALVNRFCLLDKDGDGVAEAAILVGAKRAEDTAPIVIPLSPLRVERNFPLKVPTDVAVTYVGTVGLSGANIGFEINYLVAGKSVPSGASRTVTGKQRLPKTLPIDGGAQLTVLSYDPSTKAATVRIDKSFEPGPVHFTLAQSSPVYVYVPAG